jgi:NAD(P)-dependent dehydrogenase (short-subunit alcohol dehydrogenase family)
MSISVITGTTHGIGLVTARALVRAGHSVVMLCRNLPAANTFRNTLHQQFPHCDVHVVQCDLASLASVRAAADVVLTKFPRLDQLINNAGIVSMRNRMSTDGFELTFATNHLGPFLLTELLHPTINSGGRILNVASCAHHAGTIDFGTIKAMPTRNNSLSAYRQSKLANVLHTFALARRLTHRGIYVACIHPGVINSNLLPPWLRLIKPWFSKQMFGIERGAQTTIQLALTEDISRFHGQYVNEYQQIEVASSLANSVALQEALWSASYEWTRNYTS